MLSPTAKFFLFPAIGIGLAAGAASAKPRNAPAPPPLAAAGEKHLERFSAMLEAVKADVTRALPRVDTRLQAALDQAHEAVSKAQAAADEAAKNLGTIGTGRALVAHAKGKWIGGAEKGIAKAQEDLKNAKTDAEREAARKELAHWEANKQDGIAALNERQAALDAALKNEAKFKRENDAAQSELTAARQAEANASKRLLESLSSVLANDALDTTLAKGMVLTTATPHGLAEFAQNGPEEAALIDQLFADPALMKEMLVAGGAAYGQWGNAMAIYTDIRKASPRAADGHFRRLAIATSLEHARPIPQSRPADQSAAPQVNIDPVKRYLHYEKAYLDGELDPAFKTFTTWEFRHVVNCDAPDEILQWGRTMLNNYRPDHISNPDYGWRYVSSVRTEVPYGSQNVKYDDPSLHQYQNIIRNGGVCGRRAFYGRFILRAFGIPTWGVTQKAHAALSHWSPKGWVVNLGAGYGSSWWDKDEVSLSGNQFLLETQARAHADDFIKVLRAQWISRILGEPAYNERRKVEGGFWSRIGLYQQRILAATAMSLGPLGQELGEANEREQKVKSDTISDTDREITVEGDIMIIPAVANSKSAGKSAAMRSASGDMLLHCLGGFSTQYEVSVPKAGKYQLAARVATVQTGQQFSISANGSGTATEIDVPYTLGMWQPTEPVELTLNQGTNTIHLELKQGSRGVTVKDLMLKAAD
jgi:hypothetical protein